MNTKDLKGLSLLLEFTQEDREELIELLDEDNFEAGSTIFSEGDEADSLYLVAEGSMRIESEHWGRLGLVCEGGAAGALSLVVVGRRQANAVAESDCRVLTLSRSGFRRLAEDAPRTACRLVEAMVREQAILLRDNLPVFEKGIALAPS